MQSKWIELIKEQPEHDQMVLVYADGDIYVDTYFEDDEAGGWWFDTDHLGRFNVTHWMPLPEPPK